MRVYGGPIVYLLLQSVGLFAFIVWKDEHHNSHILPQLRQCLTGLWRRTSNSSETSGQEHGELEAPQLSSIHHQDPSVLAEIERVTCSQDPLRIINLQKTYHGASTSAVQDLTFSVKKNEVFALLGPNGAGKSTTIGLIRGDHHQDRSTGGSIVLCGEDITFARTSAREGLAVCPQFDALDDLTAYEHLEFYARAHGIKSIPTNISTIAHAVGLTPHLRKRAAHLSGGTKRKLSLAIALIGNPSILVLDEPSSGMDAAAKRAMWRTLKAITPGRSILLTTHSMEEADALADRVGIMARSMLAVGDTNSLRKKWSDGLWVHLCLKGAPRVSESEMGRVVAWIRGQIPGAFVERQGMGQVRFRVPGEAGMEKSIDESAASSSTSAASSPAADAAAWAEDLQITAATIGVSPATTATSRGGRNTAANAVPQRITPARLFALLEASKADMGFEHYSVSQATLDHVFLSVVGQHNAAKEGERLEGKKEMGLWQKVRGGVWMSEWLM